MEIINYAHRGASEYAPENTIASFLLGAKMGANGVETDIQRTKDGTLVLFHDDSLMRICGRPEAIHDLTFNKLRKLDFGIHKGSEFKGTQIPTFEEFLIKCSAKYKYFAIEIKEEGVEEETLSLLSKYIEKDRIVITSGIWRALKTVKKIDSTIKIGYLAKFLTDDMVKEAKKEGFYQICPKLSILDDKWNTKLRNMGFSVRAWGIDSISAMEKALDMGVDGMTINYPDVLANALKRRAL